MCYQCGFFFNLASSVVLFVCGILLIVFANHPDKVTGLPLSVIDLFKNDVNEPFLELCGLLLIIAGLLLLVQCLVRFWVIYPNSCCTSLGERANAEMMWMLFGKDSDLDYYEDAPRKAIPAHELGITPCPVAYVIKSEGGDEDDEKRLRRRPRKFMVEGETNGGSDDDADAEGEMTPHELQELYIQMGKAPPPCPVKFVVRKEEEEGSDGDGGGAGGSGGGEGGGGEAAMSPHQLQEECIRNHRPVPPCPVKYMVRKGSDKDSDEKEGEDEGSKGSDSPISAHRLQEECIKQGRPVPPCPVKFVVKEGAKEPSSLTQKMQTLMNIHGTGPQQQSKSKKRHDPPRPMSYRVEEYGGERGGQEASSPAGRGQPDKIEIEAHTIDSPLCQACLEGTGHGENVSPIDRAELVKEPYSPPRNKRRAPSMRPSCGPNCLGRLCNCN